MILMRNVFPVPPGASRKNILPASSSTLFRIELKACCWSSTILGTFCSTNVASRGRYSCEGPVRFVRTSCVVKSSDMKVKKEKKEKEEKEDGNKVEESYDDGNVNERTFEELVEHVSCIANPLATRKLTKRLYKIIRKAAKQKMLRRGVKEVQKYINKGENGIVLLAGDTQPVDVICHLPIMCEDNNIPYCYIPAKQDLGAAIGSMRPTCVLLIKPHSNYQEAFDVCKKKVEELPTPY
uniref:H/ACA ribonucleoprotein complex subunit 2 isoform X2 n=1 Tax=Myxine glutinosa TaxID=7769 RepID=UPI00358FE160